MILIFNNKIIEILVIDINVEAIIWLRIKKTDVLVEDLKTQMKLLAKLISR